MRCARSQQRSTRVRTPLAPERADRGVEGEAARAARRVEDVLPVLALGVAAHQVGRGGRHGRAVRFAVAHRHEAAVVAGVEPLVGVGRPRVRPRHAGDEVLEAGRHGSPQAEGTVDVEPGVAMGRHRVGDGVGRIEGAGVHVAGLDHDEGRTARGGERLGQRVGAHAALLVDRDPCHTTSAQPQVLQCGQDGGMRLFANQHVELRRAVQAALLDLPSLASQQRVARLQPARSALPSPAPVGRPKLASAWEAQQVEHPAPGHLLRRGGRGGEGMQCCVLAPRGGQDVRRQSSGQRAADHEPEVTRPRRRHEAGLDGSRQLLEDGNRIGPGVGKLRGRASRSSEAGARGPTWRSSRPSRNSTPISTARRSGAVRSSAISRGAGAAAPACRAIRRPPRHRRPAAS